MSYSVKENDYASCTDPAREPDLRHPAAKYNRERLREVVGEGVQRAV